MKQGTKGYFVFQPKGMSDALLKEIAQEDLAEWQKRNGQQVTIGIGYDGVQEAVFDDGFAIIGYAQQFNEITNG